MERAESISWGYSKEDRDEAVFIISNQQEKNNVSSWNYTGMNDAQPRPNEINKVSSHSQPTLQAEVRSNAAKTEANKQGGVYPLSFSSKTPDYPAQK